MERVMSELACYFSTKRNVEIHLILYGINRESFTLFQKVLQSINPIFVLTTRIDCIFTLRTIIFLRKRINIIKPNTVLSFGEYWNSFVLLALLFKKYPVFVSDRSQPNKSLGRFHDRLRKWLYPKSAGIILQSQKAKEIYQEKFKGIKY